MAWRIMQRLLDHSAETQGMDLGLEGLRVIVTAGAAGIGREIALAFSEEGAVVEICDVDAEALATAAAAMPEIRSTLCDVADGTALRAFVDDAAGRLGGLDVLVNNAGNAGPTARIEQIDETDWQHCLDVCLTSQFHATKAAVAHLRRSANASIVNLSSAAGKFGFALRTPYAAAKWGVIGLTKSLAIELGPDNIRVNAILPGLVAGDRQRRVMEAKSQQRGVSFAEIEAEAFSYTSIKHYVTARQIADQILFLASSRGRTVSGQAISVDGDTKMLA